MFPTSASDRFFGGSKMVTLSSDLTMTSVFPRVLRITTTAPGQTVYLPPPSVVDSGPSRLWLFNFSPIGTQPFTVRTSGGVLVDTVNHLWCADLSYESTSGTWISTPRSASGYSGSMVRSVPFEFELFEGYTEWQAVRECLLAGWDGESKVSLTVKVSGIRGSQSSTRPALNFSGFPLGSTLLLFVDAIVGGKGGNGGRGGDIPPGLLAFDGEPGGDAIWLSNLETRIVNNSALVAGGGGGGGGAYVSGPPATSGGGGGGGVGFPSGLGGAGGYPSALAGNQGAWVAVGLGGVGGAGGAPALANGRTGGAGGTAGVAGAAPVSGGNGGAAGRAITYTTAVGAPTFLRAGFVYGSIVGV